MVKVKVLSDELKNLVRLLEKMSDDIVFTAKDNMLQLKLVNIERTAFAELGIVSEVKEEGKFAIRVKDLKKVVGMFPKQELEITTEDGFINFKGEKKQVKIPEIETEEFEQTLPEFQYEQTFKIDKAEYKQLIKDLKELGEAMKISGDTITVVDSQYEYSYKLEEVNGNSEIVVSTKLFELPLILGLDVYEVKFGSETPLVVEFDSEFIKGRFVIAPRIEESV